jgi:hypothetical protein
LYEHEKHPTWTLIEPISKDIQIGSNFPHIITRTQFPIQLVVTHIVPIFNQIYGSHIDHIWTNAPMQQCISKVVEACWIDHKPIYFAFKLPDYVPQYHHISKK